MNSVVALPGKGSHSRLMPWKLCPNLEWIVRSFAVIVQRGSDQLVDILLIGWWWGKWESASATDWFQYVWVYVLVGSIQFTSTWQGFQYLQNSSEILLCISAEGELGPWPMGAVLFLSVLFHLVFDLSAYGIFVSTKDQTCTPCSGSSLDHQGSPDTIVSWLFLLCLCTPSLPSLAAIWTSPLELRGDRGCWLEPIACNQEMDIKGLLCPGAP